MKRILWRIAQRYLLARAARARRAGNTMAAAKFKSRSEKFFHKIKGAMR
ncbi:hypothetical protein [Ketogulonicigenium vulgare]|uniref:Uncharacterized protein n=1 Tax=Ketogulonicigenium vulgare (strain WSH-001) TaxID=759362 RepID=F9Y4J8_KETVW|nr:hypothetical protein [Ketogulonicigenium vulgare]AEM40555.1 hypothetical protein KVU_0716 [Ketogulonicigenium vulgare WSH-001]ALJ80740.1 hypothetical protein KVH_05805 [Ketogulonicigenium vulgare]ANW34966.1 hypothetical protein KvSKV_05775 [Ketogulonicigenium vulgare]AOZ54271.1 hypothetical protein KVC_1254 [Ketogulonicigenium vulgare]